MAADSVLIGSLIGDVDDTEQANRGLRAALRSSPVAAEALKRALQAQYIKAGSAALSPRPEVRTEACARMGAIADFCHLWFAAPGKSQTSYA